MPKFEIDVFIEDDDWTKAVPDAEDLCVRVCQHTIIESGIADHFNDKMEVAISLAFDTFIQDLNKRFRNKDKPTNVLSFPNTEISPKNYKKMAADEPIMLGDIVVAYGVVKEEAEEQEKSIKDHLTHMIVHGTLHLLGYDHMTEKEAENMESLEISLLKKYGIANPYILAD